ncbi:hypothetical protein [Streptomyces virginiae]
MAKRLEPHRSLAPVGTLLERAKGSMGPVTCLGAVRLASTAERDSFPAAP